MARSRYQSDQSPEDLADEKIRYNKRLQQQQQRDDLVAARVRFRNQALAHGIPSTWLPSVSQVKSMDDSTWNFHNERINRLGFYGVDDMGQPLSKPAQSPLVPQSRQVASPASPLNSLGRISRQSSDDLTLNRFSTTQADARNIAAKYGGEPAARPNPAVAATLATDISKSPLNTIANPPKIASESLPSASTALLGVPSGQDVPPGAAVRAGQVTRKAIGDFGSALVDTSGQPSGTRFNRPAVASVSQPLFDVPGAISGGVQSVKDIASSVIGAVRGFGSGFVSGNGGDKIAAGVTNATAAQFEKPTKENPVPVTPTTPVTEIDKTPESLGRFGMSDDEFNRRKFAFAGF